MENLKALKRDVTISVSTHNSDNIKVCVETRINPLILSETPHDILNTLITDMITKLNEVIIQKY